MSALPLALVLGGLVSVLLDGLVRPRARPIWRSPATLLVHLGSWCLLHALFLIVVQRPWFATAFILSLQLVLLQTNHVKWRSLREPFVYQDFDYFLDALRHPRLYLPFFGIWLALAASLSGAAAIGAFLWFEPWLLEYLDLGPALLLLGAQAALGILLLRIGLRRLPEVTLDPARDLTELGLCAYLWSYALQAHRPLDVERSPPAFRHAAPPRAGSAARLPDVVVVQSESFFDPRRWSDHVDPALLPDWDRLKSEGLSHGPLRVPAWGANTVRSEAAFLTGLTADALGIHRFSPYRQLVKQPVPNLLGAARRLGYRTVAVHPYPASFYLRHRVLPALGAECFVDIERFTADDYDGQYVSDAAVAREVGRLLDDRDNAPLFIFVISMENHGPLHLEKPRREDAQRLAPAMRPLASQPHYRDLMVYLRHLENANHMLKQLSHKLTQVPNGGLLCWYGDHVPIMESAYRRLGEPDGSTDYLLWSSRMPATRMPPATATDISQLGVELFDWIRAHADSHCHPGASRTDDGQGSATRTSSQELE